MTINHQTHQYRRHQKFNNCENSLNSKHCKRERLFSNWCRSVSNWSVRRMHVLKHRCVLTLALSVRRISYIYLFICLFVCLFLFRSNQTKSWATYFYFLFAPYFSTAFWCCAPLGKNTTTTTAESRITGAFGFLRRLLIHGEWTSWPNIGKHQFGTTGILLLLALHTIATAHSHFYF